MTCPHGPVCFIEDRRNWYRSEDRVFLKVRKTLYSFISQCPVRVISIDYEGGSSSRRQTLSSDESAEIFRADMMNAWRAVPIIIKNKHSVVMIVYTRVRAIICVYFFFLTVSKSFNDDAPYTEH